MAALTAGRQTDRQGDIRVRFSKGINATTTLFEGGIVALDASTGYLRPGRTSTTDKIVGVARDTFTNGATAGATIGHCDGGIFKFLNSSAGDAIAIADKGALAYVVDDQTVAKTDGTGTRVAAGRIFDVDSDGVWVAIGLPSSF